jgi:hypothetical protein
VTGSVDPIDKAKEVADEISFPVAYGVTRADADTLGSFWEDRRSIIQPSEFILDPEGKVMFSSYSDGPLARLDPTDLLRWINFQESKK